MALGLRGPSKKSFVMKLYKFGAFQFFSQTRSDARHSAMSIKYVMHTKNYSRTLLLSLFSLTHSSVARTHSQPIVPSPAPRVASL